MENVQEAKKVALSLISAGRVDLAREVHKVIAFDTRFSLLQPAVKAIYLLEIPIHDFNFEVVYPDDKRKILSDEGIVEILKAEKIHCEKIIEQANAAKEQLKRVGRFAKVSDLILDPEVKEVIKLAPEVEDILLDVTLPEEEAN